MPEFWKCFQFGTIVQDFFDAAPDELWEAMEDRLGILMERGNMTAMPASEPLGNGLFALRANADNLQGRLIYFFGPAKRQITVVHAIHLKKTRKIPQADIDIAERNRKIVLADTGSAHEFTVN